MTLLSHLQRLTLCKLEDTSQLMGCAKVKVLCRILVRAFSDDDSDRK